ncbi:hypothetical protein [Actinoplanes teichomyceticus]|uniref:Uncharacterized protein n=1 Tax=Actinoplanes teichomyceticus TaxID=1867 RepID=A0A561VIY0_ACTTI|nr:hypothetical protein [Actinoplanes teichomyceticus]TWG11581.1 hypothetical protein FHX34_106311 [Actinoplanes teichomyceticus]GIF16026.1 hypothetical protein Ate01nite_60580 [Actinoplanes teichomyceticus]
MSAAFRPMTRRSLLRTFALTAVSTSVLTVGLAPAALASDQGGTITRAEAIQRGQRWVNLGVPYSQSDYYGDGDGHTYRQDCSGMVSMMWHLTTSRTTATFRDWSGWTKLGSYSQLKTGDALLGDGHIVMFDKWTDSAHTRMKIYQEPTWGRFAEHKTVAASYYTRNGFVPYRYDKIVEDASTGTPDAHGPLYMRTRTSGGAWASSATLADSNEAISATASATLSDGSLHVFNVIPNSGIWYRSRSASGAWGGATKIDTNGKISAIAATGLPDGTINVQAVVPGSGVWNRTRSAAGVWAGSAVKIDDNGDIVKVSSAGLKDGSLQVQTLVPNAGVWNRTRSASGTWAASAVKIDDNDEIISIAAAALPNGTMEFFGVVSESGIWNRGRSASGVWDASATKIDENGSIDGVSAAGLPNGTVEVTAVLAGSGLWNRGRSAAGAWDASATKIDANGKIFDTYTAGLADGTLYVGGLVNVA